MAGAERAFSAAGNRWAFPGSRQIQRTTRHKARQLAPCPTPCLPAERFSCGLCAALPPVLGAVVVPPLLDKPVFCCRCSAVAYLLGAVLQSITRGRCRASFCHLAAGQPVMSSCPGCWFWLSCCLGAALLPVLPVVVVPPCAACRASKTVMAAGHPFMGRGGRRRWGNPVGVPRPLGRKDVKEFNKLKNARARYASG